MASTGGRPSKYNPEIAHHIVEHLRYGATIGEATKSEGICRTTFDTWVTRHRDFLDQVERAQADPITRNLRNMNVAAMRGSWQASAWLLERLAPDRFGKAATEIPALIGNLLAKLPADVAAQVVAAWGIVAEPSEGEGRGEDAHGEQPAGS